MAVLHAAPNAWIVQGSHPRSWSRSPVKEIQNPTNEDWRSRPATVMRRKTWGSNGGGCNMVAIGAESSQVAKNGEFRRTDGALADLKMDRRRHGRKKSPVERFSRA